MFVLGVLDCADPYSTSTVMVASTFQASCRAMPDAPLYRRSSARIIASKAYKKFTFALH
jgi:hypothetical protein